MQQNKVGEPKLFKLFGHFSLVLLLSASALNAQTFEDFKRSEAESFQKYKDERDNEFNNYLKAEWKAYRVEQGVDLYEKPKPKEITPAQPIQIKSVGPKISIKVKEIQYIKPESVKKIQPQEEPLRSVSEPQAEKPDIEIAKEVEEPVRVTKKDINFEFFGSSLAFNIPDGMKSARFYPQNQKGITNFFESAALSEYEEFIKEIQQVSKTMNLNDWGVYLLVIQVSDKVFSNPDDSKLLSWFLFNKLGYAVKVGLADNHVVVMHYSKKTIYSTPNYSFDAKKFYVVSNYAKGSVGQLFSYKQNYPGANKPMDLSLLELPNFELDIKSKTLSFVQYGKTYNVPYEYNQNLIDFMATYPQADYETFFNAPIEDRTYTSIATAIKEHVDGKQASDAMNFVLNFVQNSFAYQRDNQQFGREKVMFAQETLYFDKSDCEDRAVLFSYLIKELFGVGVLGVKYKDHMATALYIPMEGDYVEAGSRKFVVADPTYINASIGQSMPKYKPQRPESFIVIKNN